MLVLGLGLGLGLVTQVLGLNLGFGPKSLLTSLQRSSLSRARRTDIDLETTLTVIIMLYSRQTVEGLYPTYHSAESYSSRDANRCYHMQLSVRHLSTEYSRMCRKTCNES